MCVLCVCVLCVCVVCVMCVCDVCVCGVWCVCVCVVNRNRKCFNPLNAKLNPICHLLALLGAHHIFHVSGLRVNAEKCRSNFNINLH